MPALVRLAADAGLAPDAVAQALDTQLHADAVAASCAERGRWGITGVPLLAWTGAARRLGAQRADARLQPRRAGPGLGRAHAAGAWWDRRGRPDRSRGSHHGPVLHALTQTHRCQRSLQRRCRREPNAVPRRDRGVCVRHALHALPQTHAQPRSGPRRWRTAPRTPSSTSTSTPSTPCSTVRPGSAR